MDFLVSPGSQEATVVTSCVGSPGRGVSLPSMWTGGGDHRSPVVGGPNRGFGEVEQRGIKSPLSFLNLLKSELNYGALN